MLVSNANAVTFAVGDNGEDSKESGRMDMIKLILEMGSHGEKGW